MTRNEMAVAAHEEAEMLTHLRGPGATTLLSTHTVDRVILFLRAVDAALRAPAVTGAAGSVRNVPIPGPKLYWRCFHCDRTFVTEADAAAHFGPKGQTAPTCLAAPPAGGAPPALVALDIPTLLQEAKRFGRLAEQFVGSAPREGQARRAERDNAVHALRDAEKLLIGLVEKQRAWSPAPAPLGERAKCHTCGFNRTYSEVQAPRCPNCLRQHGAPAPVAPDVVDGQCPRCGERDGAHAADCRHWTCDHCGHDREAHLDGLASRLERDGHFHPCKAEQAHGYLSRVFTHHAPQCTPLPDLMGVCTQIDNLLAGMAGAAPVAPPAQPLREMQHAPRPDCDAEGWHLCAPPADVPACPDGQHNYRRNAPPQPGDVCFVCRKSIWMPAPPAVAGGDAPEIQVGDWYQFLDCDVAEVIDERWLPIVRAHLAADELTELRGERDGQPFIWRRRQEGQ